ncbi:MAG: DUF7130 family rubredoxin-like protein [Haloferacaceae archaeon]
MGFESNHLDTDVPNGEHSNKGVTEIPIGSPREAANSERVMWRCGQCGTMGRLRGALPERCPDCLAPREELYYYEED